MYCFKPLQLWLKQSSICLSPHTLTYPHPHDSFIPHVPFMHLCQALTQAFFSFHVIMHLQSAFLLYFRACSSVAGEYFNHRMIKTSLWKTDRKIKWFAPVAAQVQTGFPCITISCSLKSSFPLFFSEPSTRSSRVMTVQSLLKIRQIQTTEIAQSKHELWTEKAKLQFRIKRVRRSKKQKTNKKKKAIM